MKICIIDFDPDDDAIRNNAQIIKRQIDELDIDIRIIRCLESGFSDIIWDFDKIITTGSPKSVNDKEDILEEIFEFFRTIRSKKIPALCICFGHQVVAKVFGGSVVEGEFKQGFHNIELTENGVKAEIFKNIPKNIKIYHANKDYVSKPPEGSKILCKDNRFFNSFIFENFHCVQFHPEMNPEIVKYICEKDKKNTEIILNGMKIDDILALEIIKNFIDM